MKITITQKENSKWTLSFGSKPSTRKTATLIYTLLERRLLRFSIKEKTSVEVKLMDGTGNDSIPSLSPLYILGISLIFLEDYLDPKFLRGRNKKYESYISN